jgi:hypothetical protein
MPTPRISSSQWPLAGERQVLATLQFATITTDAMGGRSDPAWTTFAEWRVKAVEVPFVVSDTEATILYELEGPYRRDLWDYYNGGTSLRIIANGLTLKVIQLENPLMRNRTLLAHCGKAVNTQ